LPADCGACPLAILLMALAAARRVSVIASLTPPANPCRPSSSTRRFVSSASACSERYAIATSAPSRAKSTDTKRPIPLSPIGESRGGQPGSARRRRSRLAASASGPGRANPDPPSAPATSSMSCSRRRGHGGRCSYRDADAGLCYSSRRHQPDSLGVPLGVGSMFKPPRGGRRRHGR
jgi:hypothetical protein